MNDELPEGWTTSTVAEVSEDVHAGFASGEKAVANGVKHLRMNNIGLNGELVLDLIRTVPEDLARPQYELASGDVLVCTTNSGVLVGKCAYFDLPGRYTFSNHLTRLRPIVTAMDARFLRWSLWFQWKSGTFDDKCKHWVNQSAIPKDALLGTKLAVPPLPEQHRIVEKIDALLAKVHASRQRLAKIPTLLTRFRQAVLTAACNGQLTASWRSGADSRWESVVISDVAAVVDPHPSHRTPAECDGGVPYIGMGDIDEKGHILRDSARRVSKAVGDEHSARYRLKAGDVVFGKIGTLGKPVMLPGPFDYVLSANVVLVQPDERCVAPAFVFYYLASQEVAALLSATNNATSQPAFGIKRIRQLSMPLPSVDEQKEIVGRVESMLKLARRLEVRYEKAKAQVDKLTQSILAKAFRGELVPTEAELAVRVGREYETAEALLKRINQQRGVKSTTKMPKNARGQTRSVGVGVR